MTDATTDQRLIKGARARATIARHAADVASTEGLTGLSLGRLAADLGLSKSGVATLFGSKENLQLAAVQSAREVFVERVVRPALAAGPGVDRVRALVDEWLEYVREPVFPGGCFRSATIAEFDSRPGAIRDALIADRADWLGLLSREIARAQADSDSSARDPDGVAFEIDAVLVATNTALQLGDSDAIERSRGVVEWILADL
ncbi:TetR/AcrR family transcriptional regulator [Rhodococcus gannanensis]|uniref:TetR/AcrR family transcriptional regulator n=1 Tax=Rhodococcus gannanensis TaxID=1960308 RepID=A0ABW4NZC8_9NOCA